MKLTKNYLKKLITEVINENSLKNLHTNSGVLKRFIDKDLKIKIPTKNGEIKIYAASGTVNYGDDNYQIWLNNGDYISVIYNRQGKIMGDYRTKYDKFEIEIRKKNGENKKYDGTKNLMDRDGASDLGYILNFYLKH